MGLVMGSVKPWKGGLLNVGVDGLLVVGFFHHRGGRCAIPAEVEGRGHAEREGRKRPGTLSLGKIH